MKPLAIDLCCGKGGWTIGLIDAGWNVIGVDVENMGGYPGQLVIANVLTFALRNGSGVGLVVASPPCQEFSYRSFPFKRCRELAENVPPDESIWRACEKIAAELCCPLIIENVRGAVKYMGKAAARYGPFYLWGDVPALIPSGKHITKGFGRNRETQILGGSFGGNSYHPKREFHWNKKDEFHGNGRRKEFNRGESQKTSSSSQVRKQWSAKIAMIPYELAFYIGKYFINQMETKSK